jgi:gliding motility-associated-like protein
MIGYQPKTVMTYFRLQLFILCLLCKLVVFGQAWCERNLFPGDGRRSGSSFAIGTFGYHCFGTNGLRNSKKLWEYQYTSDSWIRKTDCPGPGRRSGVSFVIGTRAYLGLGWEGSRGFRDFYSYDQTTDTWTTLDSFPSNYTTGIMSASVNGKGYLVGGATNLNQVSGQLYEYNPLSDQWLLLMDSVPMGKRMEGVMEEINGEIYVGLGHDYTINYADLWKYTPFGNTWVQLANFPGTPRTNPISFAIDGKLIVGGGFAIGQATQLFDYYIYDPSTDSWAGTYGYLRGARSRAEAFVIGDSAYVVGGWNGNNSDEVWRYGPFDSRKQIIDLCDGEEIQIGRRVRNARYLWQDSSRFANYRVTAPGVYWVNLTTDNCTVRDSFVVNYYPKPQVDLGKDTSFCDNQPFQLSAFYPNSTFLWQDSSTTSSFVVNKTGVYSVAVTLNRCTVIDSISITYFEPPTVDLGPDRNVCFGESVTLNAFDVGATYRWQDGSNSPTYLVNSPGLYHVTLERNGCITQDSVIISYIERPSFSLGSDTTLCEGDSVTYSLNILGATYEWSDGSTTNQITITTPGLYWVEVSLNGCKSRDSITVSYDFLPVVSFGEDKEVCFGQSFFLDALDPNATAYEWQDGSTKSRFYVFESGKYHAKATNYCGVSLDTINIIVKECDCNFFVPNAFSPNGDGVNDSFGPTYSCDIIYFELQVFNRWGELIYQTTDINAPWEAKINNEPLPLGAYIYKIRYQKSRSVRFENLQGTVLLLK